MCKVGLSGDHRYEPIGRNSRQGQSDCGVTGGRSREKGVVAQCVPDAALTNGFPLDVAYLYESLSEKQGLTRDSSGK